MSKARRIEDAERTAVMLDLLRRGYNLDAASRAYVVLEEVAPGTGWYGGQRWADALVLSVWPSNGLTLDGYEIKASRADLKRELTQPSKHRALARFCDSWTLIAWDSRVVEGLEVPLDWGITLTQEAGDERELFEYRKAEKRTPEPWPRSFVCSLVRNAYEQAPGAAFVSRAVLEAHRRAQREYRQQLQVEKNVLVQPLIRALYGSDYWRRDGDPEGAIKDAVARLAQPLLAAENAR